MNEYIPAQTTLDFNTMAPKHHAKLMSFAFNYTRRKDAAEDLVQDTYIRAFTFWPNFSPITEDVDRDVLVWLRRILSNIFFSQCQREKRKAEALEEYGAELNHEEAEEPETDFNDKTQRLLSKMKPELSEIMTLHYVDGLSYKELAVRFGVPLTKIQKRLWRAREEFKGLAGLVPESST